jgi:hypothetical protein
MHASETAASLAAHHRMHHTQLVTHHIIWRNHTIPSATARVPLMLPHHTHLLHTRTATVA